jgi:hypothetical protein
VEFSGLWVMKWIIGNEVDWGLDLWWMYSPGHSPVLNVDHLELHRWLEWNGPTEG